MKKSDLKNGMIVEDNNGKKAIVLLNVKTAKGQKDIIKYKDSFAYIENFDDNLIYYNKEQRIVRIYDTASWAATLGELFSEDYYLKLIWERELDWDRVDKFTKVQVRFSESDTWRNRYYLGRSEKTETSHSFKATPYDEYVYEKGDGDRSYPYCRLHESVKIKEEWYK